MKQNLQKKIREILHLVLTIIIVITCFNSNIFFPVTVKEAEAVFSPTPLSSGVVTDGAVYSIARSNTTTYIGGNFTYIGPNTGGFVPVSSTSGLPSGTYPRVNGTVFVSVSDGSGGLYIGGSFSTVDNYSKVNLAHINGDGSVDVAFQAVPGGTVYGLALSGSTLYVAGAFTVMNGGVTRNRLAAVNASTGVLTSWDPNIGGSVYTMILSGSSIYIGGAFTTVNGSTTRNRLAEISISSGTTTSWNPNIASTVYDMVLSGTTMYIGGAFTTVNGSTTRNRLAALDTTVSAGTATTFDPNINNVVNEIELSGTTLYAGGTFTQVNASTTRNYLAAFDTTAATTSVTSWNPAPNGTSTAWSTYKNTSATGITSLLVNGSSVYAGGVFTSIGGQSRNHIAEIDTSGNATSWNPAGANSNIGYFLASGSNIYISGNFSTVGAAKRIGIAAFDNTTGLPTSFQADTNSSAIVYDIQISGGTVFAGGTFTTIGGSSRNRLAALDASTGAVSSWNPNISSTVHKMVVSGSILYIGGEFTTVNGSTTRNHLAAIDTSSASTTSWNPSITGGSGYVYAMVLSGTTLYIGGTFSTVNGSTTRNNIAAILTTSDTNNVTAFDPSANNIVWSMALSGTTLYIGGEFSIVSGIYRDALAAIDTTRDISNVTSFVAHTKANVFWRIKAIQVRNGIVYTGGTFSFVNGLSRNGAAAIRASDSALLSWNPSPGGVEDILIDGATMIIGGSFTTFNSTYTPRLAILSDPGPAVEFANSTQDGSEAQTSQALNLRLSETVASDVTVNYAVTGGTATGGGTDYIFASGSATITAGNLATTIPITLVNDTSVEPTETVLVTLSSPTNASLGINSTLTFRIIDNDTASLAAIPRTGYWVPGLGDYVNAMAKSTTTVYMGGQFQYLGPQVPNGIALNASTGIKNSSYPKFNNEVLDVISDGAGGYYVGGWFTKVGGVSKSYLVRILSSGSVDTTFNPSIDAPVRELLLDGSTLYLGGDFLTVGGQSRGHIASVDATTGDVTSFNPNVNDKVYSFQISGTTLYAAGKFTSVNGGTTLRNRIAAFDTTTGLATSFDPNCSSYVLNIILSGSSLYAGGAFTTVNGGTTRNRLAEFDTATGTVSSWNPNVDGVVHDMVISGTTMYIGGEFFDIGASFRQYMGGVSLTTGLATTFDPQPSDYVFSLALSGTTLYVAGEFKSWYFSGSIDRPLFAAIDTTVATSNVLSLNANFEYSRTSFPYANKVLVNGGDIFVGGWFRSMNGVTRNHLGAIDLSSGQANSWNPNMNTSGNVYDMAISGDNVYVVGPYSTLNGGTTRNRIAAINATSGLITSWDPNANSTVDQIRIANGYAYVSGFFTTLGGGAYSRNRMAAIDLSTGIPSSFDPNPSYLSGSPEVEWMNISSDGTILYVGGHFTSIGGQSRNQIGALDTSTGLATSWNPIINQGATAFIKGIYPDGSDVYISGIFTYVNGAIRNNLVKVDAATGQVTSSWAPNPNDRVNYIFADSNYVYASGDFTSVGGIERRLLVQLDKTTGLATGWDPRLGGTWFGQINSYLPGSLIIGGGFQGNNDSDNPVQGFAYYEDSPNISFTSSSASGSESTSPYNITLTLSSAAGSDVVVDYAVSGGTATGGGVDYTLASGQATITAGNTTTVIPLSITNDNDVESDETVIVSISNPTNALLGSTTSFTYTIQDDDTSGGSGSSGGTSTSTSSGGGGSSVPGLIPPPAGYSVTINGNAATTASSVVTLDMVAGSDITQMAISNTSDFAGISLVPFTAQTTWNLCNGLTPCLDGQHVVYVKFYNQYGVSSPSVSDDIDLTASITPPTPTPTPTPSPTPTPTPTSTTPTSSTTSGTCIEERNLILAEYSQALSEIDSIYRYSLTSARSILDASRVAANDAYATTTQKLLADYQQAQNLYNQSSASARTNRTDMRKSAQDQFQLDLKQAQSDFESARAQADSNYDKSISDAEALYDQEIILAGKDNQKKKDAKTKLDNTKKQAVDTRNEQQAQAVQNHNNSIKAAQDKRKTALVDIQIAYDAMVAKAKVDLANAKAIYDQGLIDAKAALNDALNAALAAYNQSVAEARTIRNASLAKAREARDAKLAEACKVTDQPEVVTPPAPPEITEPSTTPITEPSAPPQEPEENVGASNVEVSSSFFNKVEEFVGTGIAQLTKLLDDIKHTLTDWPKTIGNLPLIGLLLLVSQIPILALRKRGTEFFGNPLVVRTLEDMALIIRREWLEILSFFGLRKRRRFWGTVYDTKTKQPLDPVIVRLLDAETGQEVDQSITDLAGRYGFLVQPGKFRVTAQKSHYAFPSTKVVGTDDGIFDHLYYGAPFEVIGESQVFVANIPMDPLAFDWNQQDKQRYVKFHPIRHRLLQYLIDSIYWFGFGFSFVALLFNPEWYNVLVFTGYIIVLLISWFWPERRLWGRVFRNEKGQPVSGIYMELHPQGLENVIFGRAITDFYGKFFLKAPQKSTYDWVIKESPSGDTLKKTQVDTNNEGLVNIDVTL